MTAALLSAEHIGLRRGPRTVLKDISVTLRAGERVALLGPNGAGKTSLLRVLLGLVPPDTGHVWLGATRLRDLPRQAIARTMAYVPQAHQMHFPYRVRDVVALGRIGQAGLLRGAVLPDTGADAAAMSALRRMRSEHLADRAFPALSGGERQAVLLARALVQGARVLVLDEPETGLDWGQQQHLAMLLAELARQGHTVLATTHDPVRARERFDHALLLRDGRLMADGPVARVLTDGAIDALYTNVGRSPEG
ncbi:ferrichrome ABC transporter ATP-binding protein [Ameyamaea chiangmaiensis NBRC 103196]|uniref:ABC transporter ATP-binding protein n=1 Tax=Ameyamaea chiangmaiensis TaxID=442969 RepID=A0A850PCS2_9PROT|nr:ABC transporter ATP-binding protein [Ameyamaea chiangmaiensis]MBS4075962.1 ABC transporter ATP-binding protein [Ameyamaea chiangmaiensis]NVN39752.1 ABC transporter ATP-binding protein [Ameyamaea chiangmaiensis]GBQ61604.1 ferrichrome ABC transporter ATP-binding protein [Ameyamaea chiangmaiensis NBRC 103196]